jgi:F-type H+-transporting ATPase subunit delta
MAHGKASRRYAKALFQLAQEEGRTEGVRDELGRLGALLRENGELQDVLLQPLHPVAERRAVLSSLAERMGASLVLRHFYAFLIDQRRLVDFETIEAEFEQLADEAAGLRKARVRSAAPLSSEQAARLKRALEARVGGDVALEMDVDPGLIGGVVAQVGDTVYDGSLRSQLEQLRSSLARS